MNNKKYLNKPNVELGTEEIKVGVHVNRIEKLKR